MGVPNFGKTPLKLLVVDPCETVRTLLTTVFACSRHEVVLAETPEEGFLLACDHHPDVVLADFGLKLNGAELCRWFRQHQPLVGIPFILMSSYARQASQIEEFQAGCDQVVYKPFKPADIFAAISTALRRNDSRTIHVLYRSGAFGYVSPDELTALIAGNQIVCFRRGDGVAMVNRDIMRGAGNDNYHGPERRRAAC